MTIIIKPFNEFESEFGVWNGTELHGDIQRIKMIQQNYAIGCKRRTFERNVRWIANTFGQIQSKVWRVIKSI